MNHEEQPIPEGWVFGRHAILEAIAAGRPVERIYLAQETQGVAVAEIRKSAKEYCPIDIVPREAIDRYARGIVHQGAAARIAMVKPLFLTEWLETLPVGKPLQIIMCDCIVDPGNLGAIVRSASVFGASAVLLGGRRAPLSPAVAKTSAGCLFHMPMVLCENLGTTVKDLKDAGFWVYATAEQATETILDIEIPERLAWVIGSEERGVSEIVRKNADKLVSIPTVGTMPSLNASVSAGIVLYTTVAARLADSLPE